MKYNDTIAINKSSKGAPIFKKMLEDKNAIHEHIKKGGKIPELKEKFNFVKPLSISTTGK